MNIADVIGWVLVCGMLLASFMAIATSQERLGDPGDNTAVFLEQLPSVSKLQGNAVWRVLIYRQSGNVHSEKHVRGNASTALATALSAFRRAKIDAVHVPINDASRIVFTRPYHDHRGTKEGRKVSRADISRIDG